MDEEGYADWVDHKTRKIDNFPRGKRNLDIHAWYRDHDWVLSVERIGQLKNASDAARKPVFLCGVAEGDSNVWHYFDKVVALVIDVDTLKRRVANREDSFGKLPEELERILRWHNNYEDSYRQFGALIVDATRPAEEVVDLILAKLQLIASRPMGRDRWRGPPSPAQRHHRAGGWPVSPSP